MSNFFSGYLAKGSGSGSFVEINYPGYARQPVTFGPMANGQTGNVDQVAFTASAPWLPVTQDALFDANGNALLWWPTANTVTLGAGQSLNITPGAIRLFFAAIASAPNTILQISVGSVPAIKPGGLSVTALAALQVASGALSLAGGGSSLTGLPTTLPSSSGVLWNNGGLISIS